MVKLLAATLTADDGLLLRHTLNQNNTNLDSGPGNATVGQAPGTGVSLDDVYYTLFRHKWLLLGSVVLGVVAALVVPSIKPPRFESQAKVMLKYVLDTPAVSPANADYIKPTDSGGQAIMNSEMEILASADVAEAAAELVGPERILAKLGGGNDRLAAAAVIRSGLKVEAPPRTTVFTVTFSHRDPDVVQQVLRRVLETYNQKHREVHTGYGVLDEYYTRQRDEFRDKIAVTEEQLRVLKAQVKIFSSVKDAKDEYQIQIQRLTGELLTAETELAMARAVAGEAAPLVSSTNALPSVSTPAEVVKEYTELLEQLQALKRREREMMLQMGYTTEHPAIDRGRRTMAQLNARKADLEQKHDGLGSLGGLFAATGTNAGGLDVAVEVSNVKRLNAKVETLRKLLSNIQAQAISVIDLEPQISQLERRLEQDEKDYRHFQSTIERSRQGESAGAGKGVNMSIVQHPTPPGLDPKKLMKLMGVAFAGCVGFGVCVAFLFDFVFDRTIRRSGDVRRHVRLPLFLSIPDTSFVRRFRLPRWPGGRQRPGAANNGKSGDPNPAGGLAPWDNEHHLRSFADGLRERLITYFEVNNLHHKPKLVGVTGCGNGAGVTTLASGLAASLSKIGEGNVLVVDMNAGQGMAHSFHSGKPGCALANVLEPESRGDAQVQENLYLATLRPEGTDKLAKVLPSHFMHLMPKLKTSGYDYIVFDMPPITPTSTTPRLAGNLDMVLLVLESEKTPQQVAGQAGSLLAEAHANVAVVLNKCRKRVPQVLSHDP